MLSYSLWKTLRLFSHLPSQHLIHQPDLINSTSSTHTPDRVYSPPSVWLCPSHSHCHLSSWHMWKALIGLPPSSFRPIMIPSPCNSQSNPFPMEIRWHYLPLKPSRAVGHPIKHRTLPRTWLFLLSNLLPTPPLLLNFSPSGLLSFTRPLWSCH